MVLKWVWTYILGHSISTSLCANIFTPVPLWPQGVKLLRPKNSPPREERASSSNEMNQSRSTFSEPSSFDRSPCSLYFANHGALAGAFVEAFLPHPLSLLNLRPKTFFWGTESVPILGLKVIPFLRSLTSLLRSTACAFAEHLLLLKSSRPMLISLRQSTFSCPYEKSKPLAWGQSCLMV